LGLSSANSKLDELAPVLRAQYKVTLIPCDSGYEFAGNGVNSGRAVVTADSITIEMELGFGLSFFKKTVRDTCCNMLNDYFT
jgi:hypothetical protein